MSDKVFVSYSRRDQDFVLQLARDLDDRGVEAWIDADNLHAGADWEQGLGQAIAASKVVILVISPDSMSSKYVADEIRLAEQHGKSIVPLFYRSTELPDNMAQVTRFQIEDFRVGGYAENFADLVIALDRLQVQFSDAPELSSSQQRARRRERLGDPVAVNWGQVWGKVPRWGLAWGLGWGAFWLVLLVLLAVTGEEDSGELLIFVVMGFAGGFVGGIAAGAMTMFVLRRNATNLAWDHMSTSIRALGIWGPVFAVLSVVVLAQLAPLFVSSPELGDCSGFGECIGAAIGGAIAYGIMLVFFVMFFTLPAFMLFAAVLGWRTVRAIRRVEPGITRGQTFWVVVAWGGGALVALISTLVLAGMFGA